MEEYVTLKIPVTAYYDGHNNPNGTFNNPEKSNTVKDTIILKIKKCTKLCLKLKKYEFFSNFCAFFDKFCYILIKNLVFSNFYSI